VSATGNVTQNNVVVTDYIPGYDPARASSGKTTYLAGSAACVGGGTCTVTYSAADHKLTWQLGDMAAGTSRQVTFKVTIDQVTGDPGETVAVDILNAGAVQSTQTPVKPSNVVRTPVTEVFPVKQSKPPAVLPHTGASLQPGVLAAGAVALLGLGLLLVAAGRRRPGSER
jgi:LPXTG-motif cell wall-anchored protein